MGMRVDEAGKQGGITEIDGFGADGHCGRGSGGLNFSARHHHDAGCHEAVRLTVEQACGAQDDGMILSDSRAEQKNGGEKTHEGSIAEMWDNRS
jgi:hypothetical protein